MLSVPIFRFTFFNTDYPGGIVVPAPLGWRNASISLERHEDYHSLVEYFKGSFIWYGLAREVLTANPFDLNFQTRVLIEINYGSGFETIFDGLVDWVNGEDISKADAFYKYQAPIIRADFWSKFLNRKDTPVDLQSVTDLDGGTRTAVNKIVLPLTGQIIRAIYRAEFNNDTDEFPEQTYWFDSGVDQKVGVISLPKVISNSIDQVFNYESNAIVGTILRVYDTTPTLLYAYQRPLESITVKYKGVYTFTIKIILSSSASPELLITTGSYRDDFSLRYAKNDDLFNNTDYTKTNVGTDGVNGYTVYDLVVTDLPMEAGDSFRYWMYSGITEYALIVIGTSTIPTSFVEIIADTVFPDTKTDAFLIKDAAESILSKITGTDDVIVSSLFDTGCERLRAIMRGKHVRGYSFADKQFFMSFKEWEDGALPQIAIGLGYIGDKIEIEKVEDFYDPAFTVTFDSVADLVRTYDNDKIYKNIEVGYNKGLTESESGIDDTQTKRKFRTKYSIIGSDFKALSNWLAASLSIEKSRRNRVELGKDDRNDEEIMSICVSEDDSDYLPELDENFTSITGLLNSETRYNTRDSATRVLNRWKKWLFSCLSTGDKLFFASGEGNYEMASTLAGGDCEAGEVIENGDLTSAGEFIFKPVIYKFSKELSWEKYKLIRDSRKKAIGVSRGTSGHKACFIIDLDYKMAHRKADFLVILGEDGLL